MRIDRARRVQVEPQALGNHARTEVLQRDRLGTLSSKLAKCFRRDGLDEQVELAGTELENLRVGVRYDVENYSRQSRVLVVARSKVMRVSLEDDALTGNVLAQTERSETDDVLDGRTESGIGDQRSGGEALR